MKYKSLIIALILSGVFAYTKLSPVNAQEAFQQLQVSPVRHNIEVNPGERVALEFKFYNLGDKTLSGILKSSDFVVSDNKGTPQLLDTPDSIQPKFSGASWITLPFDRLSIAAKDQAPVRITIDVPTDARPGGRYVAVYFEPASSQLSLGGTQDAGATISQRIAGLIYIRVKGPVSEKAYISRLFGPTFLEYGPITVETEILNRGDYHVRPRGSIALRNFFKSTTDQKAIDEVNIFPDTSRSYSLELGQKWMFGRYTISAVAAYGDSGQVIQRSIDVWVFPWKIALALFLGLIILFIVARYVYRSFINRQHHLEAELKKEHEEIEKLRDELNEQK